MNLFTPALQTQVWRAKARPNSRFAWVWAALELILATMVLTMIAFPVARFCQLEIAQVPA